MLNIIFPQKENITNDLEKLNDTILWRKCDDYDDYLDNPEGDYFTLRRRGRHEPEDNVSFFALNPSEQIEDNGFNFLSFIFCYPFRNPFCIDQLQFSKSASVSLKPKKLLILVRSSRNLAEKLLSLKITKHQKNKPHATHYGLYFQKDINNGVYYDLDADVKRALYQCSDLDPLSQKENKEFLELVFDKCNNYIFLDCFNSLIKNLIIYSSNPSKNIKENIKENIKKNRKNIINILNKNEVNSSNLIENAQKLISSNNLKWNYNNILDSEFYPEIS